MNPCAQANMSRAGISRNQVLFILNPGTILARIFHEKAGLISKYMIVIAAHEIFTGKYQVTLCTWLVSLRSPAFSPFGPVPGRRAKTRGRFRPRQGKRLQERAIPYPLKP
jgi:hypothetical protein